MQTMQRTLREILQEAEVLNEHGMPRSSGNWAGAWRRNDTFKIGNTTVYFIDGKVTLYSSFRFLGCDYQTVTHITDCSKAAFLRDFGKHRSDHEAKAASVRRCVTNGQNG